MGRIVIAGIGPGEVPLVDRRVWEILDDATNVVFRSVVHPGYAAAKAELESRKPGLIFDSFDALYERAGTFESLYDEIAETLVNLAREVTGVVLYLVPGSPLVAEKSVDKLRKTAPDLVTIIPGVSFLELVWTALGIDPFEVGITMVDAVDFPPLTKVCRGPFLLTQVWSRQILSEVKVAVSEPADARVIVLQGLGTASERVLDLAWDDMDKLVEPDHLTSLYVPDIPAAPGPALVALFDIIGRLRKECPWDREQTHPSLVKHLIEESYEVIDAIERLESSEDEANSKAYRDFEGELGDLLVQVYFHSNLADEDGRFNLSDVAETVSKKLIRRHPHVFGELEVGSSEQVLANWEKIKQTQEGRESVLEGIPHSLPTLLLVAKLLRKATAVGIEIPSASRSAAEITSVWEEISHTLKSDGVDQSDRFGELLWWISNLAKEIGIDLESALRSKTREFMETIRAAEAG